MCTLRLFINAKVYLFGMYERGVRTLGFMYTFSPPLRLNMQGFFKSLRRVDITNTLCGKATVYSVYI
jgi:hypothetical protein